MKKAEIGVVEAKNNLYEILQSNQIYDNHHS